MLRNYEAGIHECEVGVHEREDRHHHVVVQLPAFLPYVALQPSVENYRPSDDEPVGEDDRGEIRHDTAQRDEQESDELQGVTDKPQSDLRRALPVLQPQRGHHNDAEGVGHDVADENGPYVNRSHRAPLW